MSTIKFIYFDVGGVAILDFSGNNKWAEMKQSFGVNEENIEHFNFIWNKYESRICLDCDIDTIISEFRQIKGISFPDNYSMLADFVDRFEPNPSLGSLITVTKEQYKVGLLTNMYPRMLDFIFGRKLLPEIEWNAIIDSSVVGSQKPDPAIYQKAEEISGVKPEEIFFVDNSEQNINEAIRRGWKTYLYNPQDPKESSKELSSILGLNVEMSKIGSHIFH